MLLISLIFVFCAYAWTMYTSYQNTSPAPSFFTKFFNYNHSIFHLIYFDTTETNIFNVFSNEQVKPVLHFTCVEGSR